MNRHVFRRPYDFVPGKSNRRWIGTPQDSGVYARFFDGIDDKLYLGGIGTPGAATLAAVIRRPNLNTDVSGIIGQYTNSGGLGYHFSVASSGAITCSSGFTNTATSTTRLTTREWAIVVMTKAAGTVTPRAHLWTPSLGWQHENTSGTIGNPSAGDYDNGTTRFSEVFGVVYYSYSIAVAGIWNSELSDGNVETLSTNLETQDWYDLSPILLWDFNQTSVSTPVEDLIGSEDETTRTGTTVITDGPANWVYGVSTEQVIAVDQAAETDTAQAITSLKTKSVTQTLESDTAQAITRNPQARLINQSLETDTSQAITVRKTVTVNQASETDTAQEIDNDPIARLVQQVSETDTTQEITERKTVTLEQSSETDIAQAHTSRKQVTLAQDLETDTAQAITSRKTIAVAQASETNTAQTITVTEAYVITVNQAAETDTSQATTARKTVTLNQVSETDTAQAVTRNPQARLINQALETDTSQDITERKTQTVAQVLETNIAQEVDYDPITRLIGTANETDTAQSISVVVATTVNQTEESDTAQAIDHDKTKAIGQSAESDTAQSVTAVRTQRITVEQVVESDTTQAITARKTETVEQTSETDEAGLIQRPGQVVQVFEADTAQAITARKTQTIGQVSESDTSQSITSRKTKTTGLTLETDQAQNIYTYTRVAQVSESDIAQSITARKYKVLGQTEETDTAQEITTGEKVITVTQVIEVDLAFDIGGVAALGVRGPGLVNLNENQFTDIFVVGPNNIHQISAPSNQLTNPDIVLTETVIVTHVIGIEAVSPSLALTEPSNFKAIEAEEIINQIIETQGIQIDNPGFIVLNEDQYTTLIAQENSLGITPESPSIFIDTLDPAVKSIVAQQVALAIDEEPSIIVIIEPENSKQVLQQENTYDLVDTP